MSDKKPLRKLNVLLAKDDVSDCQFHEFLNSEAKTLEREIDAQLALDGALYTKRSEAQRPRWAELVDAIAGLEVDELSNKSSSAVLFLRTSGRVFAFTFGYGRFLLNLGYFEQDFGLKTALNTLDHESLRSVDLHTLEDQPIQKKSQSARGSEASVFGVDIFRDVLRAVTGSPRTNVAYKNISGGDAIFSFALEMLVEDIPQIAKGLLTYYRLDHYKDSFGWVDNIRQVKDSETITSLDESLLEAVKNRDSSLIITMPEIVDWDSVEGFSFTRSKRDLSPTIDTDKYLENIEPSSVSIESIRRDRLFVTDVHENEFNYSVYSCMYLELDDGDKKQVIFGGKWYEIDKTFMAEISGTLSRIEESNIPFPGVQIWEEEGKPKIETEADYNERTANQLQCHLLDKKLVKCSKTTSPIELCDLLTSQRHIIHVKHRKGGSAGLSHLFAQGGVSAEVMLGDRIFRKEARKVLGRVNKLARDLVPLDGLKSSDYEVIFLILGDANSNVKDNLPFFSKVNLARVYENLSQRGYSVKISGAEKVPRDST